ncbi:MAG: GlmU family protein [Bacteroidota bacterium]
MRFCIFEDTHFSNFLPLDYFRPVYNLRCGITSLEEKLRLYLPGADFSFHTRQYLAEYMQESMSKKSVNAFPEEDTWFINGRVIGDETLGKKLKQRNTEIAFYQDDGVIAAFIKAKNINRCTVDTLGVFGYFKTLPAQQISCNIVRYPWDLIQRNPEEIERDFKALMRRVGKKKIKGEVFPGVHLINKKNIYISKKAQVKPGVVLDAEKGPIMIDHEAIVMPNAVIEGPAYIGRNSVIKIGAKIYHGTSIGEFCKVGGEVDASIIHSYSNKQHDGFLGHSYIGSWVNIGADTNNSDLKNNYSTVKMRLNGEEIDTGLQFVGLIMGDHSKTGINVMFDTGTNIGVCCNIYGSGLPPKYIPSFSWGSQDLFEPYDLNKCMETARTVMKRRDVEFTPAYEKLFRHIHTLALKEKQ